jgi:hypothetical protein
MSAEFEGELLPQLADQKLETHIIVRLLYQRLRCAYAFESADGEQTFQRCPSETQHARACTHIPKCQSYRRSYLPQLIAR